MTTKIELEYFLVRYTPNALQDSFINIGLVMVGKNDADFGAVRFLDDWHPILVFDPDADIDLLKAVARDLADQITGKHTRKAIVELMKNSFSNVIRISKPTTCSSRDPEKEFDKLVRLYLSSP